jgi:uncharacterized protein (TIGR02145 family)
VRWKKAALENCTGAPCVTTPPVPPFVCGTSTIADFDGNTYNTVLIGTQCWTKENLKVTKYNDGTLIPDLTTSTSNPWAPTSGARTDYTGATGIPSGQTYVSTYGYLYNWYAVNDAKGLCPTGWHVPTDSDWNKLVKFIDSGADTSSTSSSQSTTAGGKMKSTSTLWNTATPETDNFGFTALPGGSRTSGGSFTNIRFVAFFWSATVFDLNVNDAWFRSLNTFTSNVLRAKGIKSFGASIRCLKD